MSPYVGLQKCASLEEVIVRGFEELEKLCLVDGRTWVGSNWLFRSFGSLVHVV